MASMPDLPDYQPTLEVSYRHRIGDFTSSSVSIRLKNDEKPEVQVADRDEKSLGAVTEFRALVKMRIAENLQLHGFR